MAHIPYRFMPVVEVRRSWKRGKRGCTVPTPRSHPATPFVALLLQSAEPVAYPKTAPGSSHAGVYLKEASTGTIVAAPWQIWKFNAPSNEEVRAKAIASGDDPDRAVASMPPPGVWLKVRGNVRTPPHSHLSKC